MSWLSVLWDFLLDWLSVRTLRVNNLLCLLLMYRCSLHTPRTQFYKCTWVPLGLVGLLTCLRACRLAAQFYMIVVVFFFRILFKNTQELSNFLYTVPQLKPTEVTGKTPTVFELAFRSIPYSLRPRLLAVCMGVCNSISRSRMAILLQFSYHGIDCSIIVLEQRYFDSRIVSVWGTTPEWKSGDGCSCNSCATWLLSVGKVF